jgi:hypothetical protein
VKVSIIVKDNSVIYVGNIIEHCLQKIILFFFVDDLPTETFGTTFRMEN